MSDDERQVAEDTARLNAMQQVRHWAVSYIEECPDAEMGKMEIDEIFRRHRETEQMYRDLRDDYAASYGIKV